MKPQFFIVFTFIFVLLSCNNKPNYPSTDIGVANAFIKDILENDYKDAKIFVLDEEMNNQYFDLSKKEFGAKTKEELKLYRGADVVINEIKQLNDSVTIVNFSNSYRKTIKNEVKVVRFNDKWRIDLKHTFQ